MGDDIVVKYIDLKVINDQILILVAMVNPTKRAEVSGDGDVTTDNMVTLATGMLVVTRVICYFNCSTVVLTADTPSPRLRDVIIINSEVTYQVPWQLLMISLIVMLLLG